MITCLYFCACRSVAKLVRDQGSGSGSVKLGYRTVSNFTLRLLLPNTQTATKENQFYMHLQFWLLFTHYIKG